MTIFYLKSLLSIILLLPAGYCMFTMFQVFGGATVASANRIKRQHKISGYAFLLIVLFISYLCVGFAAASKTEPSPRAVVHIVLALSVLTLLVVKISFVHRFRQFYLQVKHMGLVIGVMSIVMIGISGGYFLTMTRFGQERAMDKSLYYRLQGPLLRVERIAGPGAAPIRTDRMSIEQGKALFMSRCSACHDPLSARTIIGPGLQGLLKNTVLPKSKHPATAESIRFQLRQPMGIMPSFAYLNEEEMDNLIAYLNTL